MTPTPALRRSAFVAGGLALAAAVVWAATGGGNLGRLGLAWTGDGAVAVLATVEWARRRPPGPRGALEIQAVVSGLLCVYLTCTWALSGGGSFWPIFVAVGLCSRSAPTSSSSTSAATTCGRRASAS